MSTCMSTGMSNFKVGDKVELIRGWCEELSRDAEYTVKRIAKSGGLYLEGSYLVFNCNCFRKVTPPPRCFKEHDIVQVVGRNDDCDPFIGAYGTVTEDSDRTVDAYYPSLGRKWTMLAAEVEVVS